MAHHRISAQDFNDYEIVTVVASAGKADGKRLLSVVTPLNDSLEYKVVGDDGTQYFDKFVDAMDAYNKLP